MKASYGMGSLRKESLKKGGYSWIYRWYCTRPNDGKRVERSLVIGTTEDYPTERAAWAEVMATSLPERVQSVAFKGNMTVAGIVAHFIEQELGDQTLSVSPRSHTTVASYQRCISLRILPRWGRELATSVKPLEIEHWLKSLKRIEGLANPTLAKTRNVMGLIYKHAIRHELIPNGKGSNPLELVRCRTTSDYESLIIEPAQAFAIWQLLPQCERLLLLLCACTGLRVSEGLGLQWDDIDIAKDCVHVRRAWTGGKIGPTKTKASRATVPMHPLLAAHFEVWRAETPYGGAADWIFASFKLKGKQPRVSNILVEDYLRPAAAKAGSWRLMTSADSAFTHYVTALRLFW
jgi:integrase